MARSARGQQVDDRDGDASVHGAAALDAVRRDRVCASVRDQPRLDARSASHGSAGGLGPRARQRHRLDGARRPRGGVPVAADPRQLHQPRAELGDEALARRGEDRLVGNPGSGGRRPAFDGEHCARTVFTPLLVEFLADRQIAWTSTIAPPNSFESSCCPVGRMPTLITSTPRRRLGARAKPRAIGTSCFP
jgi:hypothetical protein